MVVGAAVVDGRRRGGGRRSWWSPPWWRWSRIRWPAWPCPRSRSDSVEVRAAAAAAGRGHHHQTRAQRQPHRSSTDHRFSPGSNPVPAYGPAAPSVRRPVRGPARRVNRLRRPRLLLIGPTAMGLAETATSGWLMAPTDQPVPGFRLVGRAPGPLEAGSPPPRSADARPRARPTPTRGRPRTGRPASPVALYRAAGDLVRLDWGEQARLLAAPGQVDRPGLGGGRPGRHGGGPVPGHAWTGPPAPVSATRGCCGCSRWPGWRSGIVYLRLRRPGRRAATT